MREIRYTTQFKKDLKRYKNRPDKIAELQKVIELLRSDGKVSREYNPHLLYGKYIGYMECHIESDLLLIWLDDDVIKLVRLGTHSELFK